MSELFGHLRQAAIPASLSLIALSLLNTGLFVSSTQLERALRQMEGQIRAEYATRQDIQDVKGMLQELNLKLGRLEELNRLG
jgi:hypothetical protein